MKNLALKFLSSFWFWWAFLIFVALYGPDLRSWYQTKVESSRLRAAACARMVELEFLAADKDRSCREINQVYMEGLRAAVHSQTPRLHDEVSRTVDRLNAITDRLDPSAFRPITLEEFWNDYEPTGALLGEDYSRYDHVRFQAPSVTISGYRNLRIEKPEDSPKKLGQSGLELKFDKRLAKAAGERLKQVCRRSAEPCKGEVYMIFLDHESTLLSTFAAVGLRLEPITEQQVDSAGLDMFDPRFNDLSRSWQNARMQGFLDIFTPDYMQKHRSSE